MTLLPSRSSDGGTDLAFSMAGGDPFEHYSPGARVTRSAISAARRGTILSTRGFKAEVWWDGDNGPTTEKLMQLSWVGHIEAPENGDFRICGSCLRGWGSKIVTPPPGYFSHYNARTGRFHGKGRPGRTSCGRSTNGNEWAPAVAARERIE